MLLSKHVSMDFFTVKKQLKPPQFRFWYLDVLFWFAVVSLFDSESAQDKFHSCLLPHFQFTPKKELYLLVGLFAHFNSHRLSSNLKACTLRNKSEVKMSACTKSDLRMLTVLQNWPASVYFCSVCVVFSHTLNLCHISHPFNVYERTSIQLRCRVK